MIGSTIETAKAALVRIGNSCELVDLVVRGNPRTVPGAEHVGVIYLLRTEDVSARDSGGTYVTEVFSISLLLDAQYKALARGDDMLSDDEQLARAEARKWRTVEQFDEALRRDSFNGSSVTSARVEVTDEVTSYVDGWFVGRIALRVACETGPVIG